MMSFEKIEILDVGPRDGLQNESRPFSTQQKIEMINRLVKSGIKRLEVASFVHPRLVPQMADAEDVIAGLDERPDVTYVGLILNERGLIRAAKTRENGFGIDEVGCVAVASDSFGQKNQNQTSDESVDLAIKLINEAKLLGLPAQVTISTAFGCPFEGNIPKEKIVEIAKRLGDASPLEIAIADTIGAGVPNYVEDLFGMVKDAVPDIPLRGHFHNTRNTGVANSWAAARAGAKTIDASLSGLGGCPFAPKATGNVATEDIVFMFERSGVSTNINLDLLIEGSKWVESILDRPTGSMVSKAGNFPR